MVSARAHLARLHDEGNQSRSQSSRKTGLRNQRRRWEIMRKEIRPELSIKKFAALSRVT